MISGQSNTPTTGTNLKSSEEDNRQFRNSEILNVKLKMNLGRALRKRICHSVANRRLLGITDTNIDPVVDEIFRTYDTRNAHMIIGMIFLRLADSGQVTLAYAFKDCAAKKFIQKWLGKPGQGHMEKSLLFRALFYLQRFDELTSMDTHFFRGAQFMRFLVDSHRAVDTADRVWLQDRLYANFFPEISSNKSNYLFRDAVFGRRVCIVGPAKTGLKSGSLIDSYDLVVRMNFASPSHICDYAETHGTKTHATYFNGEFYKSLDVAEISFLTSENIYMVFRNKSSANYIDQHFSGHSGSVMRTMLPLPLNFASDRLSLFGLQRVVLDLLAFSPAKLDLFNVDFFTQISAKGDDHISSYKTAGYEFFEHDPILSRRITSDLLRQGFLGADAVATEVLSWSDDDYIKCLQLRSAQKA